MKTLILLSFLIGGCSTWKQSDFEKELKKSSVEAAPAMKVDEKLLEKFEVLPVDAPAKPEKTVDKTEKASSKKKLPTTKVAVPKTDTKSQSASESFAIKPLPKDYPEKLKAINAKAAEVWKLYQPNHIVDQTIYLDIHYMGMTVGKILVTNQGKKMINGREVWHLHARFKSAPFYSKIYELDDTVDTYVSTNQFLSVKYSLIQRESKQDIDDLQLHDRDQYKTFWFYKRKNQDGDVRTKQKEKPIPYFSIDPFSVLFFYQGLPLKDKDVYEIPIINKGDILIFKSTVEGREEIETSKGTRKAIRVHATTQYTGDQLKSGDLYFWFSDDDQKILLKAQAKIKIGSVTADLVK